MDLEANVNTPKTSSSEGGGKRDHNDEVMGVTADGGDGGTTRLSISPPSSTSSSDQWCSSKNVIIVWIPTIGVIIALGLFLKGGWLMIFPAFYSLIAAVSLSVMGCICAAYMDVKQH